MNQPDYHDRYECLSKGWFSETGTLWPGQAMSIQVKEKLYDQRSEFQHLQVFETETYGRMLILDGVIQTTDRDESSY
jgi:spermidine synthase